MSQKASLSPFHPHIFRSHFNIKPTSTPPPPPQPENPPPPPPPLASNGTSNNTIIYDVSNNLENNRTIFGLMHNMSDDELLLRASRVDQELPRNIKIVEQYKVAFMFLTPGHCRLLRFGTGFSQGIKGCTPFMFTLILLSIILLCLRILPSMAEQSLASPVYWGTISMIDAERRLLANALLDPSNQRFVLLSDSCIPVFNFTTIYNYLMGTNHSFLGSFDDPRKPGHGRYNA
ncbi:hypothetical protein DH2020_015928 [Rehmannia glutinosa]|uniref:Uncharacterized protein n=1 Tax=Rehmannia glutinosa TaxID=99300 RepID=A0ABR0WUJ8_REHGL